MSRRFYESLKSSIPISCDTERSPICCQMYISMNFIVKVQKIQKNQNSIVTRVLAIFLVVMPQLQHWEPFCPCSLMPQVMLIKSMCHNDILLSIHPRRKQLKKKIKKNCHSVSPHFNGFFGLFFGKSMFFGQRRS